MTVRFIYRDSWLKPLDEFVVESRKCPYCMHLFKGTEFVTSCEFCDIGFLHTPCADSHVKGKHEKELQAKINDHRDRPLHGFQ